MLLSNRGIEEEIRFNGIIIDPYKPELVQPSSVDVLLGPEFKIQNAVNSNDDFIDFSQDQSDKFSDLYVPKDDGLLLFPGSFVLGATFETVALGSNITARLEGKSSLGRLGLVIHATAGFIDPGFEGQITLELSNVGTMPILLKPGMKIGQLAFFKLPEPTTIPYGSRFAGSHYQNQAGPTTSRSFDRFKIYDVYPSEELTEQD